MRKIISVKAIVIIGLVFLGVIAGVCQCAVPEWVKQEKIRSYWGPPPALIEPLYDAGFNVIVQRLEIAVDAEQRATDKKVNVEGYSFEQAEQQIKESSAICKRLGMRYFFCLNLAAMPHIAEAGLKGDSRRCDDGVRPCPLDERYWDRVIINRFNKALELLEGNDYRIDGFIIDPEMYAFPNTIMTLPCYCKDCIAEFAAKNPNAEGIVDANDKAGWLTQNGLANDYNDQQFSKMCSVVKRVERAIHRQRPDLVLGFVIWENSPWFKAFATGLSNNDMPIMICDEMPVYSGAYDESYLAYQETMAKQVPVPFLNCPGIWVNSNAKGEVPEKLLKVIPGNLYNRTIRADGYFLYASDRWGGTREKAKPFTKVFRKINDELDTYLKSNGTYKSSWMPQRLPVDPPGNLRELLADAQNWRTVKDSASVLKPLSTIPHLRESEGQSHVIVFKAEKGDHVRITMSTVQLGRYIDKGSMLIFGPDANCIGDAFCELNRSASYELDAKQSGAYAVVATAKSNAYTIDIAGVPWVITGKSVNLNTVGGRLFFYIPSEMKSFKLNIGGSGEAADFILYDPNGTIAAAEKKVSNPMSVAVEGKAGLWCIEVANLVDDTMFSVEGVSGYALRPEGILTNQSK
ncbi:MAG: hypothetical protein ACYC3B_07740 [Sedimentisphaerales bacterium]